MVFRLITGEDDESAKDTCLEVSWRFPSGWGTRIGARSTGTEVRRVEVETGMVPVGEDADRR